MMLREIEERDNHVLGKIIQASLEQHDLAIPGTVYFDKNLFHLSDYYTQEKAQYWVLEKDGKVIGGVGVGPYRDTIGEIQKFYIVKEEQGYGYAHLFDYYAPSGPPIRPIESFNIQLESTGTQIESSKIAMPISA